MAHTAAGMIGRLLPYAELVAEPAEVAAEPW